LQSGPSRVWRRACASTSTRSSSGSSDLRTRCASSSVGELIELIQILMVVEQLRKLVRGEQRDFGGAAIALGSIQTGDRHRCRGRCTPPCPSCDEMVILGVADAEAGL